MLIVNDQQDKVEELANALADGVIVLDKAKKLNTAGVNIQHANNFQYEFEEIDNFSLPELKKKWCELYNCKTAPGFSKAVLVYKLKYRLQELVYGGLSKEVTQLLTNAINEHILHKPKKIEPFYLYPAGTKITRNYHNKPHEITILKNGYLYDDITYKNLSVVIKKITGISSWSAARFFGLEK